VTGALWSSALVWALLAVQDVQAPRTPPEFDVRVEAVKLDVTVLRDGQAVEGLTADNFEVKDDGVRQEVDLVSTEERALHAVLVLDTSSSVSGRRLEILKAAASSFIADLGPEDAVSVIPFSHDVYALPQDPYDHTHLVLAVASLSSGGATALDDAVAAGLMRSATGRGRPMVVVFSDGADRLSWLEPRQVLDAARDLEAVVYGVVATNGSGSTLTRGRGRAAPAGGGDGLLQKLADLTGGAVIEAERGDLGEAFRRILATVQSRYVLRYVPSGVKGEGWHTLAVRLKSAKGEVRVRRGYRRSGS
jgi:Ca-activated chloride channel family protein